MNARSSAGRWASARKTFGTLETSVFLNDGSGRFERRALPSVAQFSPVHGVAIGDVDADGHLDVFLAQNDWSPQRETGHHDGGTGVLLHGDGKGGNTV